MTLFRIEVISSSSPRRIPQPKFQLGPTINHVERGFCRIMFRGRFIRRLRRLDMYNSRLGRVVQEPVPSGPVRQQRRDEHDEDAKRSYAADGRLFIMSSAAHARQMSWPEKSSHCPPTRLEVRNHVGPNVRIDSEAGTTTPLYNTFQLHAEHGPNEREQVEASLARHGPK